MGSLMKTKLVLGSAGHQHPDAVTVDIDPSHRPDVVHDLNRVPYPFTDNQFTEIVCHHVVEHLDNLAPAMAELHRICAPTGTIYIEVPHYASWAANAPEHKLRFGYFGFDSHVQGGEVEWSTGPKFRLLNRELTFHRAHRQFFLHRLFNRFPRAYERFWAYLAPAEHVKVRLQPIKP